MIDVKFVDFGDLGQSHPNPQEPSAEWLGAKGGSSAWNHPLPR